MKISKTKLYFYYLFCFIAIVSVALSMYMLSALGEVSLSAVFTLLWFSVTIVYYYPVAILVWLMGIVPIVVHYKLVRFLAQTDEQITWVPFISLSTWLSIIILIAGVFAGAVAGLSSPGAGM